MKQLYDKAIYNFDEPVKSYWEEISHPDQSNYPKLTGDQKCDVAIIGGGFTGISCLLAALFFYRTAFAIAGRPCNGARNASSKGETP